MEIKIKNDTIIIFMTGIFIGTAIYGFFPKIGTPLILISFFIASIFYIKETVSIKAKNP